MLTTINAILFVRYASPEISVIELQGEFNASAENQLMDAFSLASRPGVRGILLDFARIQFMNSAGIGALITLLNQANQQGQSLAATGLNSHFERIFDLTRLRDAIPCYRNEYEALAAMQKQPEPIL